MPLLMNKDGEAGLSCGRCSRTVKLSEALALWSKYDGVVLVCCQRCLPELRTPESNGRVVYKPYARFLNDLLHAKGV